MSDLQKIREMWFSDDAEDKEIAYKWLIQLVGMKDAHANLFILSFYKDWDDDSGYRIDDKNFWDLKFKTYPISFGKDYRYRVTKICMYQGVELLNTEREYSRWAVGNGEPKWDLCQLLCDCFRASGHTFHQELFHDKKINHGKDIKA